MCLWPERYWEEQMAEPIVVYQAEGVDDQTLIGHEVSAGSDGHRFGL
jgi:hypothetical protein